MSLEIEGEELSSFDVKKQPQGSFKFSIDAMLVEFMWDISGMPMRFAFHRMASASRRGGNYGIKNSDSGDGLDGVSSNGSDVGELNWPNGQSESYGEDYWLHIFGV